MASTSDLPGDKRAIIEVVGLTKRYGPVLAVDDISFDVITGEVFGFLGPNGAGKTTTINMLTGLGRPNNGSIRIGGIDCTDNPKAAQHLLGIVPDESNLYPELTGFENLCFCGALYGMPRQEREGRARELLREFGLADAGDRKFETYSKGMKRKLTFAAGIMHQPPILFLDEPTTGIDVASARQVRQIVAQLHGQGTTIFFTTHYIEEAERLCERIAFIVNGRIVRSGHIRDLLQPVQGRNVLLLSVSRSGTSLCEEMKIAFPEYRFQPTSPGQIRVESTETIGIAPLVRLLEERGVQVTEARRRVPSLEDVFVEVTGIEADMMKKDKERTGGGAANQ